MGPFKLIEQGKYQEFCCLYEEKAGIRNSHPELADLIPGNYLLALLGLKDYNKIVEVCEKHVLENVNRKGSLNRSTSDFYIACSIAKMELGNANEAYKILYEGRNSKYQDISRTQVACVLYYEAVMLRDEKAKKTSKNLLSKRLKGQTNLSEEFAIANFILGKCQSTNY